MIKSVIAITCLVCVMFFACGNTGSGYGNVNGHLTMTENISDAGGLSCALEIVQKNGIADLSEFFEGWATIWRVMMTPELEQLSLLIDTHAPGKLRTNVQVQLLDAFYDTYDVQEADGMYLAPEKRISVW